MRVTFSVDQPPAVAASTVSAMKPDVRPSSEFKDISKRRHPATHSTTAVEESTASSAVDDRDQLLTQRGPKLAATNVHPKHDMYQAAALFFPSLFSNDFGPAAFDLFYHTPTVTNSMTYGEGVTFTNNSGVRPTIELPPDELLDADGPGCWSSGFHHQETRQRDRTISQEDVDMKVATTDIPFPPHAAQAAVVYEENILKSAALRNVSALNAMEDVVPPTITPSLLGPDSGPDANRTTTTATTGKRPSLSVRTQSVSTRTTSPSATSVNSSQQNSSSNSAPDGVKAECANCGATHTPLWRRGLNNELNCNACGLYHKLHKRARPKSMYNNHVNAVRKGRANAAPRQELQEIVVQCHNCHTTATTLWRKDNEGKTVCNACGLYRKTHRSARPISMKSDSIRKRVRPGAANGYSVTPPLASLGTSGHVSPNAESTPALSSDESTPALSPDESTPALSPDESTPALSPDESTPALSPDESTPALAPVEYTTTLSPDESTPTLAPDEYMTTLAPDEYTTTFVPDQSIHMLAPDESTHTVAPDSTQLTYNNDGDNINSAGNNMDYRRSSQSELMGALGLGVHYGHPMYGQSSYFSGAYYPDYMSQPYNIRCDSLHFSSGDRFDVDSVSESRSSECRYMSNNSASESPFSAIPFIGSLCSDSSSALDAQHSSIDFPYTHYSSVPFEKLRGGTWDPTMPPPDGSPPFVLRSMFPSSGVCDSHMFFPPSTSHQQDAPDVLFAADLHPPMLPPDDSPPMSSLQLHSPMLPSEWKIPGHDEYDSSAMVTF